MPMRLATQTQTSTQRQGSYSIRRISPSAASITPSEHSTSSSNGGTSRDNLNLSDAETPRQRRGGQSDSQDGRGGKAVAAGRHDSSSTPTRSLLSTKAPRQPGHSPSKSTTNSNLSKPNSLHPSSSTRSDSLRQRGAEVGTGNITTFYAFGNSGEVSDDSSFRYSPSVNLDDVHRAILSQDAQISDFPSPVAASSKGGADASPASQSSEVGRNISKKQMGKQRAKSGNLSIKHSDLGLGLGLGGVSGGADSSTSRSPSSRQSSATFSKELVPDRLSDSMNSLSPSKAAAPPHGGARNLKPKVPNSQQGFGWNGVPAVPDGEVVAGNVVTGNSAATKMPRSPNRQAVKSGGATANTSNFSRRLSTYSHAHATGLGARTVSPTDARRLKRLSTMPTPPPVPLTDNMPLPTSPFLSDTKSMSPSSAATTPEPNRKSISSTLSTSSTNTSSRTSTGSLQPRLSLSLPSSRLPMPKTRAMQSGSDEEIPPVPPIPKTLATDPEPSKFSKKTNLSMFPSSAVATPTKQTTKAAATGERAAKIDPETRRRRGLTLGHTLEAKTSAGSLSKKNLQPLRLPPLNLLPLSTPTVARVNAFGTTTSDVETRKQEETPVKPKRSGQRTPSTPMTASKATFADRRFTQDLTQPFATVRRPSSGRLTGSPSLSVRASSSNSSSVPVGITKVGRGANTSPFVSSSLPKMAAVQTNGAQPGLPHDARAARISGSNVGTSAVAARTRTSDHLSKVTQESPSKTPETPSTGSSIRRKLSLSWKRSSSKASHAKEERDAEYPPKYDTIAPPPRLPSSATWSGPLFPSSPSPSTVIPPPKSSAAFEIKPPAAIGSATHHDRTKSESWSTASKKAITTHEKFPPEGIELPSLQARNSASTLGSTSHRGVASKGSVSSILGSRTESPIDADDLLAEEEMKKLGSKRKGIEAAAAQVDALQRRAGPKERVSAQQALRNSGLNIYERGEIVDYKEIYFCGASDAKKIIGDLNAQTAVNFGYDDERGDYMIVTGDHLAYRYEVIDLLGKGSFGQVVRCIDHKTGGLVAVKIIRNKKRFHQQALVEVNILQKLREWDPDNKHGLVRFTQSFYFRGHLCISTELLGMNLYEFIKSNDFRGFSIRLIRRFTKQLLSSLVLLKGRRVIHCDLKPENILLAHPLRSEIKVIDFGSSCFEHEKVYTYIQSRFYRSPEVILGMTYGLPIDMWSLGCILAELFTGYPIFPGENEQEQLACIMEVFGPPEKHLIEKSTRKKLFFDSFGKPRMIVSSKGRRRRPSSKTLQQALKCDDDTFVDFLARCLRWDPDKRMKPDEAMNHDFITGKKTNRYRANLASDSPMKKQGGSGRPLPEPPSHSVRGLAYAVKAGTINAGNSNVTTSPSKVMPPVQKRQSLANSNSTAVSGTKRSSAGLSSTNSSSLPRVSHRNTSQPLQK